MTESPLRPGDTLHSDDYKSIVVSGPDVNIAEVLASAVGEEYGGDDPDPTDPIIVRAAGQLAVSRWTRYTQQQLDDGEVDEYECEGYASWWGPDGAGDVTIYVINLDGVDLYDLGDQLYLDEEGEAS